MSQTITSAPPVNQPVGAPSDRPVTPPLSVLARVLRAAFEGSPGRLRLISAGAVVAALLVAIGGGAALRSRSSALDEANAAAAHLVALQGVQTSLVQAHADATNGYLNFGLEPTAQRQDYIATIRTASQNLAIAARFSAQDATALGTANAALTRYTGYIASSRAYNRLSVAVGSSYLQDASDVLDSTILAQLQTRSAADSQKIDAAYSRAGRAGWWLLAVAVAGLGGLIGVQVLLAQHSRRLLNLPLAASTAGLLIVLVIAAGAMALAQSRANDVRDGSLARVTALSRSRVAAFDAKSIESLTVINRGSATTADTKWSAAMKTAVQALPDGNDAAKQALASYAATHAKINKLDVAGADEWDTARKQVIATTGSSASAQFQTYAQQTKTALDQEASAATSGLESSGNTLLPAAILVVLAGLLAAVGALWGVSLRLQEYR